MAGKLTNAVAENEFKEKITVNRFSGLLKKVYKINFLIILGITWLIIFIIYIIYEISRAVYKKIKDKKAEENKEKE